MRGPRIDSSLEARALAAMLGLGALLCTFGALVPPHADTPVVVNAVAAVAGALLAAAVVTVPVRWRRGVATAALLTYVALATTLVAAAGTDAGAVTAANGLLWFCLYVASFRSPRVARCWCSLATAAIAITLGARLGGHAGIAAAVVLSSSAVVGTELLSRIHERLRRLSTTDHLTGALNRAGLEAAVRPDRRRRATAVGSVVAAIDLDGFKAVNDARGHTEGDRLLAALVSGWRRELRDEDVLARMGGDEFVLILPRTDLRQAEQVLARLRVGSPIGWSAGLATFGGEVSFEAAVQQADARMYDAKLRCERTHAPVPVSAQG